jgi:magnesium-transporting ATPase (P-type)
MIQQTPTFLSAAPINLQTQLETRQDGLSSEEAKRRLATPQINQQFEEFSDQGLRLIGIAYRDLGTTCTIVKDEEQEMTFLGFVLFFDPPKKEIAETIDRLKQLGVTLKIITGDNHLVAAKVSRDVGMAEAKTFTGGELREISNSAFESVKPLLSSSANCTDLTGSGRRDR